MTSFLRAALATGCLATSAALPLTASANPPPRFPAGAVWNQDISQAPLHPASASMIASLVSLGGFGYGRMQIDFGMQIVNAAAGAPTRAIIGHPSDAEYYAPDCEPIGTLMPVPVDAAIEASPGLTCDNNADDCHLLVVQGTKLYEAYRANASGTGLQAQCLAIWKLDQVYTASNRGEHCTSADAAGFPIAPLLFNADEVYAANQVSNGDLGHALRFILPNPRMASAAGEPLYVRPASHAGGPSGPEASVPYGSRLRLRADFPVNLYPAAAQVILRTMQRYGIVLADGGNIALTAESDTFTTHTWAELGITSRLFDAVVPGAPVQVQDFLVIDTGPRIVETYDCVRNPDPTGGIPSLSVADVSLAEGSSGSKNAAFVVALSAPSATAVTFNAATSNGSATAGIDYVASAGNGISIAAGLTSATFNVPIFGDLTVEPNENFVLNITSVVGASVADGQAIGTILNDDAAPRYLSIADVAVTEGRRGTKLMTFTVTLSAASAAAVSYSIGTGNLSATSGIDYVGSRLDNQTIAAGATSKTFAVIINGDGFLEANETFAVKLSNVVGALVSDGYAIGTITNDDKSWGERLSMGCNCERPDQPKPL